MSQPVKIDAQRRVIVVLFFFIVCLMVLLVLNIYSHSKFPERIEVEIPPRMPNEAVVLGIGEKHPTNAFLFTHYTFQQVLSCPKDCKDDYYSRIRAARYMGLISARMYKDLMENYRFRNEKHQLIGRKRYAGLMEGEQYSKDDVAMTSDDNWVAYLRLNVVEEKNDQPVRDVNIVYPIRVIKADVDATRNPWGYQLDGYYETPYVVEANEKT